MSDIFVVCNQLGQYWGKKKKWVDGTDPKRVLLCKHEDEAVNQLVELSARDIDLRGEVRQVEASERGVPVIEPSEHLIAEEPVNPDPASGDPENTAVESESASPDSAPADAVKEPSTN